MIYLLIYGLISIVVVGIFEIGQKHSESRFLLAERKVGGVVGSLSIAASWIWAPALFVSTQVGYTWGFSGLVWFVVPNMMALMLFQPFAKRVRAFIPNGFSYLEFLKGSDRSFRNAQLFILLLVQVISFSIQVTAGAELVSYVGKTSYENVVAFMTIVPLVYCLRSGLPSSIISDALQYVLMASCIAFIYTGLPVHLFHLHDLSFHPTDSTMFVKFGMASALTLLFGIFSDHQQWQRAFASKGKGEGQMSANPFVFGALLHGLITTALGTLGVLIAQSAYVATKPTIVGAEFITNTMPTIYTTAFVVMALSGLCSTVSSSLCAFGSLWATEVGNANNRVSSGRKAMFVLAAVGCSVALLRFPLILLWLSAGVIRLCSAAPTMTSVFNRSFSGKVGTAAILASLLIGAPLFVYGNATTNYVLRDVGMVLCLTISTAICLISWFLTNRKNGLSQKTLQQRHIDLDQESSESLPLLQ